MIGDGDGEGSRDRGRDLSKLAFEVQVNALVWETAQALKASF